MADLYLCGKGTNLVPLFDESRRHIDCIALGSCLESLGRRPENLVISGKTLTFCVQRQAAQAKSTARGSFTAYKPVADQAKAAKSSRYSAKVYEAEKKRQEQIKAAQEAAAKKAGADSGQLYADQPEGDSGPNKAGLFGIPTYAVVGAAVALGVAAFVFLSPSKKAS